MQQVRLAKQQLCTCITLFCTFVSHHCKATTRESLILRFFEDGNTKFPFMNFDKILQNSTPKKFPPYHKLNEIEKAR